MKDIIIAGVGIISTILSGFVTFLFTRKKYKVEVEEHKIENMTKALEFYEKLTESTNQRLEDLIKKYDKVNEDNANLKVEIEILKLQVEKLMNISCKVGNCNRRKRIKKVENLKDITNEEII